jgi:CRISPR system Cascade subunit CasA
VWHDEDEAMTLPYMNVLQIPLFQVLPDRQVSLPSLLALLTQDKVDSYPALRPHQAPAWHMFLVQLAALALHRAGSTQLPESEEAWAQLLRGLTPEFPGDEPWCLVVEDQNKPAFLQSPVPIGVELKTQVPTPDALDLLITSKNHDLKQGIAQQVEVQDWIYALVSLQTSEGYGGAGNWGIVRMNGGSSSRSMLGLAPLSHNGGKVNSPRPGAWFRRDVSVLLATRKEELDGYSHLGYKTANGLGLTWTVAWKGDEQLAFQNLDIWFIEVCRRIRFSMEGDRLVVQRGTSKATRIAAIEQAKGVVAVGDPWAPIVVKDNTSLTLSEGDFDYKLLVKLLFSGDYRLPVLARPSALETMGQSLALVAQALSRGNSKTFGFKSRTLPLGGKISRALGPKREELHKLALKQIDEIKRFDQALRNGLVLVAANGKDGDSISRLSKSERDRLYTRTKEARTRFDRVANAIFFEHLWRRFEAQERSHEAMKAEEHSFAQELFSQAQSIFEAALPSIPCVRLYRPRAEARARMRFFKCVKDEFPELFPKPVIKETQDETA